MSKKRAIPIAAALTAVVAIVLYFEVFRHMGGDSSRIEGSGTIEVTEVEIQSKIAGRILRIAREEGEEVRAGEVLVRIAYDELDAQRLSVIAALANARANLERARELYRSGSIAKKDYDQIETVYRMAKANYDQITAVIGNAVISSPIDGIVLRKNLEEGEIAFPGAPILTVANRKDAWIKIYVAERSLHRVKPGQRAVVTIDAEGGRRYEGRVVSISHKAEFTPKTIQTKDERVKLMFGVKIAVANPSLELKPGMPADAAIITDERK